MWQQIDDWLAPKGFVKLVIPGKQGSSDDSDTAQSATMMFYERFPQHAPADNTARQISFVGGIRSLDVSEKRDDPTPKSNTASFSVHRRGNSWSTTRWQALKARRLR